MTCFSAVRRGLHSEAFTACCRPKGQTDCDNQKALAKNSEPSEEDWVPPQQPVAANEQKLQSIEDQLNLLHEAGRVMEVPPGLRLSIVDTGMHSRIRGGAQ